MAVINLDTLLQGMIAEDVQDHQCLFQSICDFHQHLGHFLPLYLAQQQHVNDEATSGPTLQLNPSAVCIHKYK